MLSPCEEKYKAKNFIDTALSRGGDTSTAWLVTGVKTLGATTTSIAWVLVALILVWAWIAHFLVSWKEER